MTFNRSCMVLLCTGLLMAVPTVAAGTVTSPQPQTIKVMKTMKQVSGEIAQVERGAVTLIYKKTKTTEFEIVLPLDPQAQFEHLKGPHDLQPGDIVRIKYEERTERPDEPGARTYLTAKVVSLVKRLPPSAKRSLEGSSDE